MRTLRTTTIALLLCAALAGCSEPSGPSPSATVSPPATSAAPTSPAPTTMAPTTSPVPSPSPSSSVLRAVTTHDFGIPTAGHPFATEHTVRPPVATPPAPPLPCLQEIAAARHPEQRPGYDQMSFRFTGGFPSYEVGYVSAITSPGTGEQLPVPGATAILRVRFQDAQAHDEAGRSCIRSAPAPTLGFPAIRGYVQAGDFEGVLDFGIAVGVKPAGAAGRVRTVEVERLEGGQHLSILAVQVTTP